MESAGMTGLPDRVKRPVVKAGGGSDWLEKALLLLDGIAAMPDNWDGEGSPRPNGQIIGGARHLLDRLRDARLEALPVPFICPIAGGGIQFEWSSPRRHLEIEFGAPFIVAFLKEEVTPEGEKTATGECSATDAESTHQLLEWFAAV